MKTSYAIPLCSLHLTRALTCDGSPAAEEDVLGHWVVRGRAKFGDHYGQHQVVGHLLALDAVAQLQVRHIREGRHT